MSRATDLAAFAANVPGGVLTEAGGGMPTGAVLPFVGTTPPAGWLKANGGTIGSASSGGTARANADTQTLYTLLWNSTTNTALPIQNSNGSAGTRGANAAADFAANKRLPLPDLRAEFIRGLDDGRGVDASRGMASTQTEMVGPHGHTASTNTAGSHSHTVSIVAGPTQTSGDFGPTALAGPGSGTTGTDGAHSHTVTVNNNSGTENRPRNVALLLIIKL